MVLQGESIAESVKTAAESAVQESQFMYDSETGLYYDCTSGQYYDAVSTVNRVPNFPCLLESPGFFSQKFQDPESPGKSLWSWKSIILFCRAFF